MKSDYEIIIFYKYTRINDPAGFMAWLRKTCEALSLKGRILLAHEGINGTVEGSPENIRAFEKQMHAQNGAEGTFGNFSDVWFKSSQGTGKAFPKLKIKVRKEIVATGLTAEQDIDPNQITGKHITAEELKRWFENGEDFEIIDMRNDYEYNVGHFVGSRDSGMRNFRDLPEIAKNFEDIKKKKVLTVCTYGVRCEKASGFLKQQGFEEVYQLHGGIGTYMKQYPGQEFQGSLYVFDDRLTENFTDNYPVIGRCVSCQEACERFGNCAVDECHRQLIICADCAKKPQYCSAKCEENQSALA